MADVTVVGNDAVIRDMCSKNNIDTGLFKIVDPAKSEMLDEFIQTYVEMRKNKKPVTEDEAKQVVEPVLGFGSMMVRCGYAEGLVAGAVYSTADVCRAVFRMIGVSKDVKIASSFSLMQMPTMGFGENGGLIFADTGVVPDPNAEELADIAIASAKTARALLGVKPKVAMISFSTKGSAKHSSLTKIIEATELARKKAQEIGLDADIDGEMQIDAALVPEVCRKKAPDCSVCGNANVLVFPSLNVGNTAYKLTERLGNASAYGPVLQGLYKPASDLSRGCSAEDITGIAAIVSCQVV